MLHRRRWARRALACSSVLALGAPAAAQTGSVRREQKISALEGGFGGALERDDAFGWSVAALGDLDGDGVGDLAVGAINDDDGNPGIFAGTVWILFMNADGTVASEQKISETSGGFGGDILLADNFGIALAALGDVNGDSVVDLAVGLGDFAGNYQGAFWILFLNPDGTVQHEQKISETLGGFGGSLRPDDRFGCALAGIGDLNEDGVVDLAVGASRDNDVVADQGAVWILFLNQDGTVAGQQEINETQGGFTGALDPDESFGHSVASLGDLDGDGVVDLAVGAYTDGDGGLNKGAVWILFMRPDGTVASQQKISASEGGFTVDATTRGLGSSLAPLGDIDADGRLELAVGAMFNDDGGTGQGALWILSLDPDGTVAAQRKISASAGGFEGDLDPFDLFGCAVAALGDPDGDRLFDLAVGAYHDDDGALDQGAVWILSIEGALRLDFETEDDFATALVNGQDVSTPPEFGRLVEITDSGPNAGAAIFDATPGGPNDPSQDRDLLVGGGNVLILQTNENTTQTVPGVFARPNDDEDGGTLALSFLSPIEPRTIDLVDVDSGADEASAVVLVDATGRSRTYTLPPGWTGDLLVDGVGRRTLDLVTLLPQAGFAATATALQEPGFAAERVVRLELVLGSSGALDDVTWLPALSAAPHRLGKLRPSGPRPPPP